mmetsp:Transcript_16996/g.48380  ORF Transcript_16996/g.48380 Transcript_16996/m.48380 type:complete len:271 (-) Transcript_16996:257-1069(-)
MEGARPPHRERQAHERVHADEGPRQHHERQERDGGQGGGAGEEENHEERLGHGEVPRDDQLEPGEGAAERGAVRQDPGRHRHLRHRRARAELHPRRGPELLALQVQQRAERRHREDRAADSGVQGGVHRAERQREPEGGQGEGEDPRVARGEVERHRPEGDPLRGEAPGVAADPGPRQDEHRVDIPQNGLHRGGPPERLRHRHLRGEHGAVPRLDRAPHQRPPEDLRRPEAGRRGLRGHATEPRRALVHEPAGPAPEHRRGLLGRRGRRR